MPIDEMREFVAHTIRQLDYSREALALAEHIAVTSPLALEHLARERPASPMQEARRLAGIQLRVIADLGARLEWIDRVCADSRLPPALRVALAGLIRELLSEAEDHPGLEAKTAAFLETAVLFHRLLTHLRPWLPPVTVALEDETTQDVLMLGIPDYLHPLVHLRFEQLWELFHRLRTMATAHLAASPHTAGIDETRLDHVLAEARSRTSYTPPPPLWASPAWVNPWVDAMAAPRSEARTGARLSG